MFITTGTLQAAVNVNILLSDQIAIMCWAGSCRNFEPCCKYLFRGSIITSNGCKDCLYSKPNTAKQQPHTCMILG